MIDASRNRRQAVRRNKPRRPPALDGLMSALQKLGALVLVLCLVGGMSLGGRELYRWLDQPIREVVLTGELVNLNRADLVGLAQGYLAQGILSVDMENLAADLERQPWVASAGVSRIWPNRIQLAIEEHRPVMRWADQGLLSETGKVIRAPALQDYSNLPLVFSDQSSPQQLMTQFRILATALEQVGLNIGELRQKKAGDWFLRLGNGVPVELGSADLRTKIQRIIRVWQAELFDAREQVAGIDARYTHGLVVSWQGQPPATKS